MRVVRSGVRGVGRGLILVVAAACGRGPALAPVSPIPPAASLESPANEEASARSSPRPTACSLISREEMSGILGGEVGPPSADDHADSSSCTYTPASGVGGVPYAEVQLSWQGGEGAMLGMRLAGGLLGGGERASGDPGERGPRMFEDVPGLGDEAARMVGGLLTVRRGDVFFTIDLRMQEGSREKGLAIARKVLAGIEGKA
jgi:hypothetical protein